MGAAALPIAAGLTALTMYSQLKSAQASAKGLMMQGAMAQVQARSEALKYKQQGVAVLENINAHQAAINSRAGAGNIDPSSGSARTLSILAERKGALEFYNTADGGTIQLAMGDVQAHQYASACVCGKVYYGRWQNAGAWHPDTVCRWLCDIRWCAWRGHGWRFSVWYCHWHSKTLHTSGAIDGKRFKISPTRGSHTVSSGG
jgi:hypothetical protein